MRAYASGEWRKWYYMSSFIMQKLKKKPEMVNEAEHNRGKEFKVLNFFLDDRIERRKQYATVHHRSVNCRLKTEFSHCFFPFLLPSRNVSICAMRRGSWQLLLGMTWWDLNNDIFFPAADHTAPMCFGWRMAARMPQSCASINSTIW